MELALKTDAYDVSQWGSVSKSKTINISPVHADDVPQPSASYSPFGSYGSGGQAYMVMGYDGETNLGEMGAIKQYVIDYDALRWRSRQLYLESDICTAVVDRKTEWVVGGGLRLQSEPQIKVLEAEGIKIDTEQFSKGIEAWWKVYANSTMPDLSRQKSLNALMNEAHKETKIMGNILVVLRVIDGVVKIQHIDVRNVFTPPGLNIQENKDKVAGSTGYDFYLPNGNRVRHGVEIDTNGTHIAYYVRKGVGMEYTRILARGPKSGMLMAYMVYGKKYEIDDTAGMPLLSTVMETAKMMERYNKSAVAGAEARQDIPYFFEHGVNSKQQDPLGGRRARAYAGNAAGLADIPTTASGQPLADKVAVSTKKTVYDLPNDVTVNAIESRQEMDVPAFTMLQVDLICAAVNIPPNVAMGKYEDSFSASRVAGITWQKTFMDDRADFSNQYITPVYTLQMYVLSLLNKINAPGFLEAVRTKNEMVINAYIYARWIGDKFPDIDPLKTANHLRKMLGKGLDHAPLMTLEDAAEEGRQGGYAEIVKQVADELKDLNSAGIKPVEKAPAERKPEGEEEKK